jgi:hypothetical protein
VNQEQLKELLWYDALTGVFRWRKSANSQTKPWDIAGSLHSQGYVHIMVAGKRYLAHRLAWLYQTGSWPSKSVDHINGVKNDNRWRNLRDVSHSENLQNQTKASKGNKSGLLGVVTRRNRITAQIKVNGKIIQLGRFPTAEQAHAAYLSAKAIYHPTAPIGGQA